MPESPTRRREEVARAASALSVVQQIVTLNPEIVKLRLESNDSWLMVDLWVADPTFPPENTLPHTFAVWLNTLALYRIGEDGAVEEDPITPDRALQ